MMDFFKKLFAGSDIPVAADSPTQIELSERTVELLEQIADHLASIRASNASLSELENLRDLHSDYPRRQK
jgi:hypothetical protein